MTALKQKIARLIETTGPMSIADYMALCLFDPEHGYYTTREPFGSQGDFTTAPEISQMFGELAAVWLYTAWKQAGSPALPILAEIGPGRGTLMKDMLRTWARLDASFARQARFAMIEASPRLTGIQKTALAGGRAQPCWYRSITDLPDGPLFIIGNELFDAIPIRQYMKLDTRWHERMVGTDERGNLAFRAGPGTLAGDLLPPGADKAAEGSICEVAPARTALMDEIAAQLVRRGGAGLFIDYGHTKPAPGDTLQAMRGHAYDDVLAHPGIADLTSHVDFFALAASAQAHGLTARTMTQGDFLLGLGLLERAGQLGAGRDATEQERIRGEVERLAGPDAMGTLFKVLAIAPSTITVPPFASSD